MMLSQILFATTVQQNVESLEKIAMEIANPELLHFLQQIDNDILRDCLTGIPHEVCLSIQPYLSLQQPASSLMTLKLAEITEDLKTRAGIEEEYDPTLFLKTVGLKQCESHGLKKRGSNWLKIVKAKTLGPLPYAGSLAIFSVLYWLVYEGKIPSALVITVVLSVLLSGATFSFGMIIASCYFSVPPTESAVNLPVGHVEIPVIYSRREGELPIPDPRRDEVVFDES